MSTFVDNFLAECRTCNSAEGTYTDLETQRGYLNSHFSKDVLGGGQNVFMSLFARTKRQMRTNGSDTEVALIERVTKANETDVLNWEKLGDSEGGANPCCNPPRQIELLGSDKVTACLMKDSIISDPYCKEELAFKYDATRQYQRIARNMVSYARSIWEHWAIYNYVSNVDNTIASVKWNHPTQRGSYVRQPGVFPTSRLTMGHIEKYIDEMEDSCVETSNGVVGPFRHIIFTSRETLKFLLDDYNADVAAARPTYRSRETPKNIYINDLNNQEMTYIGPYLFCCMRRPRRFEMPTGSQSWIDSLVPSTINVDAQRGKKGVVNLAWRGAEFEETIIYSDVALEWLVPPSQLTDSNVLHTNPTDYMGNIIPIQAIRGTTECDPQGKLAKLFAEFGAGVMQRSPEMGRAILHMVAGTCVEDIEGCRDHYEDDHKTPVDVKCSTLDGCLTIVSKEQLNVTPPAGQDAYLVTKGGKYQLIGSFNGTGIQDPKTNKWHTTVCLPAKSAENAGLRDCDPWYYLCYLEPGVPEANPAEPTDCGSCGTGNVATDTDTDGDGEVDTAKCVVAFASECLEGFTFNGGAEILANAPYEGADAETVQTEIQAWLDAQGAGGTVTVLYFDQSSTWTIEVIGHDSTALDLSTGEFTFDTLGSTPGTASFECVVPTP